MGGLSRSSLDNREKCVCVCVCVRERERETERLVEGKTPALHCTVSVRQNEREQGKNISIFASSSSIVLCHLVESSRLLSLVCLLAPL